MKVDAPPLSKRCLSLEGFAYYTHGHIAINEGTDESARRAIAHFEKYLEVNKAIDYVEGIATAKRNIAITKSKYVGGNNNEELLNASRELYELRVAKSGEENEFTINAGKIYAIDLHKANCGDEARELLKKLPATSKQVLGPRHNITKDVESVLQKLISR
jgi:hypothetical protein